MLKSKSAAAFLVLSFIFKMKLLLQASEAPNPRIVWQLFPGTSLKCCCPDNWGVRMADRIIMQKVFIEAYTGPLPAGRPAFFSIMH